MFNLDWVEKGRANWSSQGLSNIDVFLLELRPVEFRLSFRGKSSTWGNVTGSHHPPRQAPRANRTRVKTTSSKNQQAKGPGEPLCERMELRKKDK